MTPRTAAFTLIAAVGLSALAPAASAQSDTTDAPLSGPRVTPRDAEPTLVERDFGGRLKRLEADPVLAALDKLTLDADTRARVDAVIAERNAIVDRLVQDHFKTIVELHNARQADERDKVRELLRELAGYARPLLSRGSLADEVRPLLPEDQRQQFSSMLSEYRSAALTDRMGGGDTGPAMSRAQAATTELLTGFGQEIKRAYDRTFNARKAEFDKLLETLNLTPEQDAKVRGIVVDQFQKSQGQSSPRDRRRMFMQIYRVLDAEQRSTLMARLREQRALANEGERSTPPASSKPARRGAQTPPAQPDMMIPPES